ncbi:DUF6455 family protein [Primorskyibacter sp. S87]|uniref:DUF6455 family protein n=1 Tax=Primorskyibacter sp. S87 TaxID=3415126 RepID=UPI003C79C677
MGQTVRLGEIERHFWLTRSVARTMGISLSEAMADGRLTEQGYAEMVTRCRAGGCHKQCELWLACQANSSKAAPSHCMNESILNRLRR